jgi:hypothetical protein
LTDLDRVVVGLQRKANGDRTEGDDMSDMSAERMQELAQRADTQSVQDLAQNAPTQEGRDIAQAELNRRRS